MRSLSLCLLIMTMLPVLSLSQQAGFAQQERNSYDLWLVRSQAITADLIKDSADLRPSDNALLWARLAQTWWRDDPEKAHAWMRKPVEMVEAVPNRENPDERSRRLATARALLKIVTPLDQKLSRRLIAILSHEAEPAANAERIANANGIVDAALALVDTDAPRAAELGALALRIGRPTLIISLILRLRSKDPRLGDALFAQTIETTRQTLDPEMIHSLTWMIFPETMQPGVPPRTLPDSQRTALLKLDVIYLQTHPINEENRDSVCMSIVSFIAPVLIHFDRLLPQQSAIARQAVNQCQSTIPLVRQIVDDGLRGHPLNTVDELLKAADDSKDSKVQTVYLFRAASLAQAQNDLDRAIAILDSMSVESREFMGGSWEAYRWDLAATSALRHFASGDVHGMRLILSAVPSNLQPYAKIAFVAQLPANRDKDTDPTLEFLSDARTGLRRSSVPEAEKSGWYFGLLPLTVKYQPGESTAVLAEAVAALNRAEDAKEKENGNNDGTRVSDFEFAKTLPASLVEMDEYAVKEAVSSISSPTTRVKVRLELLGVCLERLRSSKRALTNPRRHEDAKRNLVR